MAIDWEELRKKAQKKIDEERGSTSVQEVLPRVNQTNKEQITVNLTPNNKVLEIATKRQKEYQEELEKQKAERKQREQEAYDNTQKLKKEYQESQKWLMQHSDQNNTVIGKTTQEYIDKSNQMLSQGEAYAKAMEAYEKEYAEEYKNRMKESNAKSMSEFPETAKKVSKDIITGIGSNVALGFTRGVNAVGNFIKENAPVLTSNKYNTQQEMADYEQKYGLNENNKQEILEQYKNKYGTLEQALNVITEEKSKLQKIHDDIGGYGIYYDKQGYEEREKNIEKLKYERDLISNALNKSSVPDNIYEVGTTLLDTVGVGDFLDTFGGDFAKPLNDVGDVGEEKLSETANKFAEVAPKISGLSQNVGSLVPSIIATGVTGNAAVGTAVFAAKAKNDYYNEYLNQGYTKTEANNLSNIMTAVEVGSEYLGDIAGGVNILKKGALKDWASKPLNQAIKGYVIEGGEEVLSEVAGMIVTGENVTLEEFNDRVKSAFAGGVALSVVMTGVGKAGSVISKCKEKLSNGQKLTMAEVEQVIQEQADNEGKSVEEILDEYGGKIGEVSQNLVNNIEENINVNNEEILPTANNQNNITTDNETLPTANQNSSVNTNNTQTELSNMLKTKDSQQYQYIISNNTKVNALNESASKYFNNSEESKGYLSALSKIIKDKDIEIKFDENLKTPDGRIARGSYSNGVITINPYSNSVGEFVAIHEITHAIGTQNMIKMLDKFKNSNVEFNDEMKALLENYSSTEINEEALADVSAQLFGTQEFINNVAEAQPSLFQKIYNEIKYLWHQFRGYKNQNQFINDLYFKWTQAYNSSNKLNTNSSFSVQTTSDGNKYVQVDTDQNIFEGVEKKDYNKIAKMYIQDYLMGETQLSENDKAIIDKKSANKYTNPGKRQQNFDKKMQLTPELKNVLEISQLDGNSSPIKENSKYGKWEYYKFKFELSGKKFEGTVNIGIDSDGNKHFYEINKIKEIDDISGKKLNRSSTSSISNSIAPSKNDVNTTTKYSIQESENNSGSFNFDRNAKRYEDLSLADNIKYNKRADDKINVEIYNNNELVNQFVIASKKEAVYQLGDNIANYIYNTANNNLKSLKLNNETSVNLPKQDNKGRILSQEQQEYFKNSKVRDENGNLKTVYHGTDAKFTEFNYEYLGKNGTANGKGFYFADDINIAKSYSDGKNLVEAYVNIEKPLNIGKTTMSENDYIKFVKEVNDKTEGVLFADFGDGEKIVKNSKQYNEIIEQFREEYKYNGDDVDLVLSVLNSANMKLEDGYRLLKRVTGYDGIIVEADYKNNGETIPYTQYIPLTSEQIKNVSNTTPTNNPDIRYSTTNSNSWQKYLEKNFTTKGTRTNLQDILVQKADNKVSESKSEINNSSNNKLSKADEVQTAPKAKNAVETEATNNMNKETESSTSSNADKQHSITTKDSRYISRNSNKFINKLVENLQISKYSNKQTLRETVQEIREEVLNNGKLTNEKRKEIFDKMYSNLVVEDKLYYEEYKEVLQDINNTRFIIPDSVKADIPDFSEWNKKNLNNLVPKKGVASINIDSKYKELSEAYPNLFDVDIINPTEQLLRIVEVKNDISKARVNLQAYNDKNLGSEYKLWAEKDFNTLIDTLEQDILNAKRYRDEKNKQLEEKKLLNKEIKTIEEIKDIYALKKSYQKEYNKVLNREVLTKEDMNIVKDLLNNKTTINSISKNPNKKGILNVYNANKPLYETDKVIKNYQKKVKESRYNEMENLIQNIDEWKDKKTFGGFRFARETAQRNIRDVVGDNETAARINKELFDRYSKNETSAIKEKNELVQRIKDIGFDTSKKYEYENVKVDEATLAQLYIEKKVTDIDLRGYGVDVDKIKRGAKEYQNILDNLINRMSDELVKNGYAPVEYRKDYFPHFTESKPDTAISKIASLVGIDMTNQDLPTDIAGITETFKPGKTWMGNLLQRTGNKTDYNAYKALDKYISGAMDIIYHTSDIQRLRAFENTVRNNYASESLKEAVENVKDNDILTEQEKEEQIEIIYNREKTQLSNFVTWLREYTDIVANKKSSGDRAWEKGLGRNIYNTMNNIEGKIASNMIGGNLSVSLTNIAPLTQASATTSYGDLVIGMIQTGKSYIKNDGFDSDFLTRRKGAERLSKTFNDSISDISGKAMQFIDDFVSESIVRAKYRENLNNGMDAITAIENADTYTAEIMADRSKGALPTIFNKKNPVAKLVNMFQVEVNNTVSNYTKDMPRNSAGVVQLVKAYTRLAIGSTVFNEFMKSIRGGGDVLPDPISWIKNLILWAIGDDDEKEKAKDDLLDGLVGSVPFVQSAAGLLGMEDVGRVPISSAMPDLTKIFGLSGTDEKYKKQVLTKELTKPLLYLGLPTGGAQIKKTVEGLSTIINGGSYKYNKEGEKYLQYAVEDKSAKKVIQSSIFGKWSISEAKEYVNDGMKALNAKETKVYDNSTIPFKEFKKYTNQTFTKKSEKTSFINQMELDETQKWDMYTGFIFSHSIREKDNSSQLEDAIYATQNGIDKNEYIKAYNNALLNDVNMPEKEDLKDITENNVNINNYISFKINTKGMDKSKDKIKELKSANYSEEDKKFIYQKINSQDSNFELLMDIGIKIDDYLDYKMQEFESDKKDDGTLNGKTVQNSRKKKILNYINKSNLSYEQRLLLYGMNLSLTSNEKSKVFNYINSSTLSQSDKLELLNKVKGFTVYKSGKVVWK